MRKLILIIVSIIITHNLYSQVRVSGYYRKNGTYVQPHYRSSPNSNPYDNYSYPGNTNPYTGKTSTGNPDTYLDNYYNRDNNTKSIISNPNTTKSNSYNNSNSINNKSTEEILKKYQLEEEKRKKREEELINEKIYQFKKISKKQIPNEN